MSDESSWPQGATLDISIVTYNSANWLCPFVASLLAQSVPVGQLSLLWRDNGSSDETLIQLQALQIEFGERFQRFEIMAGDNIGFGRGHNSNMEKLQSEFFLVTNVDLEFETDTLSTLWQAASKDAPEVAAWECRQKPFEHPKDYNPVTGDTEWCSSACILFRRSVFVGIGGYEPRLFLYGEDVEISYRLRDHGYRLRYLPSATVWHHTYEHEAQFKPAQFLGSTLANILLRCRYATLRQILAGFLMYLGLFLMRPQFAGQRRRLLRNGFELLTLAPGFLSTRKRSSQKFSFRLWDYSATRQGAFYRFEAAANTVEKPVVSVLVRTMPGRSGKLHEAVASVCAQTYPAVELVIVEDGGNSAQGTVDCLRAEGRFVAVRYQALEKLGRCRGGNAALALATGKLICFLDDDDLLYADHLEVLVAEWQKAPQLGAVYGLSSQIRTRVLSEEPWIYENVDAQLIYQQSFSRAVLWHHNYLPIQTVLFDRRLYDAHGGFDPELDNLEDWNLWVRYSLRDDFRLVPKLTSLYRVPAVSEKASGRQQVLDDYYAIAQAKHAQLRVELSPPQVVAMAEELGRELFVGGISAERLRNRIARLPGFRFIYHPVRTLWHLFRRLRARR